MRYDHFDEFMLRWYRWPAKGRKNIIACQHSWFGMFQQLDEAETAALLEQIDDGIQRWLDSEEWRRDQGRYIHKFENYLAQRRWLEEPERSTALPSLVPAKPTEEAPPLECGCGEPGCAICRLLARCG